MMKNEKRLGLDGEGSNDENDDYQTNKNGFSGADMSMNGNGTNGGGYSNKTPGDNGSNAVTPDEASPMDVDVNDSMKREGGGVSSSAKITNNNIQGEIKAEKNTGDGASSAAPVIAAPVPLLKGILTYIDNDLARKHTITGMWNFESSTESQPQTFQLTRNLGKDEDPKELPKDGEFQGSFRVSYTHIGSNGKTKSRTRVIPESGVKLAFTKQEGKEDSFDIKGVGTNQYGVFDIYGTADRDELEQNKAYKVELRKKYIATPDTGANLPPISTKKNKSKSKKRKLASASAPAEKHEGPLPDPSPSYPSGIVCLRGKVTRDSTVQDGVVHHISGHWASGLELIQSDPKGERGICNEFEYEHRSTVGTEVFPISGRYTGWFNYAENGKKTRYTDRDVVLKFKKNNAGYFNVEGRGSNNFGKYNITGTFDKDHIITLFRHFVPLKVKKPSTTPASTASSQHDGQQSKAATMTLDDVEVPDQTSYEPITTPSDGQYQAISRGILKLSDDGSHICTGKWAQSRSLHTTNVTSNFTFGLDEHHAKSAVEEMKKKGLIDSDQSNPFPLDSANYKGSFKMKKGTAQPVVDQQIVMKFRKNTSGSYNVYGKGVNIYGTFDLVGIFLKLGPHSGNVELFRIYPPAPELPPAPTSASSITHPKAKALPLAKNAPAKKGAAGKSIDTISSGPGNLIRRESSRQSKLPSHLADDDPAAQNTRLMDKCAAILRLLQEKDSKGGRYFLEPVDPVAHNIPTYHEIITNPMDLGTIATKMEANEVDSPEEFARLVRLVFENAVTFNTNPMNYVHQSARDLLSIFNQKFRDVERLMKKPTKAELKEMKRKNQKEEKKRLEKDKKRKREEDQDPKLKHLALLHSSAEDSKRSLDVLSSATYPHSNQVSRNEFNMMADALKNVHTQMQHMTILIQQLISPDKAKPEMATSNTSIYDATETNANKKSKKTKKQTKPPVKQEQEPSEAPVAPAPPAADPAPLEDEEPLTHEEQEELISAINEMADDTTKIMKVIDIIKKSKPSELVDEEEMELDLDQLDTATQRKLLKFVMKVRIQMCNLFLILFQKFSINMKYSSRISQNRREKRTKGKRVRHLLQLLWNQKLLHMNQSQKQRQRLTILLSNLERMIAIVMKRKWFQLNHKLVLKLPKVPVGSQKRAQLATTMMKVTLTLVKHLIGQI